VSATADTLTFQDALLAVQGDVQELELIREATGQVQSRFFKYLTYPKLLTEVRPILTRHGLVWQTFPTTLDGRPALRYRLAGHGEELTDTMLLVLGDKQTSQAQGSALTYACRYALLAVLALAPAEDDDGSAASQPARPAPIDPEMPLGEDSVNAMLEAIAEKNLSAPKVLERAGVKEGEVPTVEQGRRVKAILDAVVPS
jgi:hypothetical protein